MPALIALLACVMPGVLSFNHGWDSVGEMLWADFGTPTLLNTNQTTFIADTYQIYSVEKCMGQNQGLLTEDAFILTATAIKALNPSIKMLFYWHSTVDISGPSFSPCYAAGQTFLQNPSWWLRNDAGNPIMNGPFLFHNLTNADVLKYMVDTPLSVLQRNLSLFDGIFADGSLSGPYDGLSNPDPENTGILYTTDAISLALRAVKPEAEVIGNGLATYSFMNPAFPADAGLNMANWMDGVCVEHWAAFEMFNTANCSLNIGMMEQIMAAIASVAARNKSVLLKSWPGPVQTPISDLGPSYPSCWPEVAGTTRVARQDQMRRQFEPQLALFLLVAEPSVYWSYSWWYSAQDGYYPAPWNIEESSAPPEWFPQLQKPLGAPLGPATRVAGPGWRYQRLFEHAVVNADFFNVTSGTVTFH